MGLWYIPMPVDPHPWCFLSILKLGEKNGKENHVKPYCTNHFDMLNYNLSIIDRFDRIPCRGEKRRKTNDRIKYKIYRRANGSTKLAFALPTIGNTIDPIKLLYKQMIISMIILHIWPEFHFLSYTICTSCEWSKTYRVIKSRYWRIGTVTWAHYKLIWLIDSNKFYYAILNLIYGIVPLESYDT